MVILMKASAFVRERMRRHTFLLIIAVRLEQGAMSHAQ